MNVAAIIDRLGAQVPTLGGRVEGALEFADLVADNIMPQVTPAAYVIPIGMRGRPADVAAGLYRQGYDDVIAVVLFISNSGDASGGGAIPEISTLVDDAVRAIAGWAPADHPIGVFEMSGGDIVEIAGGVIAYQIEFALGSQFRFTPAA